MIDGAGEMKRETIVIFRRKKGCKKN